MAALPDTRRPSSSHDNSCSHSSLLLPSKRGDDASHGHWRFPAWLFIDLLIIFCAASCVIIAFLAIYFPVQTSAKASLMEFTNTVATLTGEKLQDRFDAFRTVGKLAQRVLAETPAFYNLDDPFPPLDDTLRWFARTIYPIDMTLVLFHGVVDGFVIKSYSSLDGYNFPKRPGMISVANVSSASLTSYVDIGYFSLDSFLPINTSHPWYRNSSITYNVSSRSFFPSIQNSATRLTWTPIYVSFAQSTSAIGFGSTWGSQGGEDVKKRSTFSFHGNAGDIVELFKTIAIGRSGAALLVDVSSKAFIGGNLIDPSIKTNATTNRPRFVLLDELADPRVRPVIAAAARLGGSHTDTRNVLLTCEGAGPADSTTGAPPPCLYAFHYQENLLEPIEAFAFSLLASDVALVHVSRVVDQYGLDMRLMLVIRTDDFIGDMRQGTIKSVAITVAVVCAVVLLVSVAAQVWLLAPLGYMANSLLRLISFEHRRMNSPEAEDTSASEGVSRYGAAPLLFTRAKQVCVVVEDIPVYGITELITIRRGILKLLAALDIVGLFLPPPALPHAVNGVELAGQSSGFYSDAPVANNLTAGCLSLSMDSLRVRDTPHERNNTSDAEIPQFLTNAVSNNLDSSCALPCRSTVVTQEYATILKTPFAIAQTLVSVLATTVVANFVDLEAARVMTREFPSTFSEVHTKFLRVVMDACRAHGGTVDMFYGDRIWAHFNAQKRLPGHALMACRAILAIEEVVEKASHEGGNQSHESASLGGGVAGDGVLHSTGVRFRVRLGGATTEALCGVMGSASVKRFTVVGACVEQASALCSGAGPQRIVARNALASAGGGGGTVFPFSSLIALKTVELARLRSAAAAAKSKIEVPKEEREAGKPSKPKAPAMIKSVVFRHVWMSVFFSQSPLSIQSVVSTPVLLSQILREYPEQIAANDDVALQRMLTINTLYEHIAAGNVATANQMVASLPHWDDEWLLRQIRPKEQ
jgi:class 3 adenylate cyclase